MKNKPAGKDRPFQFGLSAVLGATTALAVLLGILKWAGAPPLAIGIIAFVIAGEVLIAVFLLASIGKAGKQDAPAAGDWRSLDAPEDELTNQEDKSVSP
jgi:hypothetical protein